MVHGRAPLLFCSFFLFKRQARNFTYFVYIALVLRPVTFYTRILGVSYLENVELEGPTHFTLRKNRVLGQIENDIDTDLNLKQKSQEH